MESVSEGRQEGETSSDARLLERIANGDAAALAALYRRRRDDVYRFAYGLCRSTALAHDVTHDVFLRLLEHVARFDPRKGTARAWLYGCARLVMLERLRRDRAAGQEPPPEVAVDGGAADEVLRAQRAARLHAAIVELPFEYREALVLCELEELSYAECAAVLRCPVGTVRSRLHRARALLAARLRSDEASRDLGVAALEASEAC